jgi:predicted RNase H-like nuclease (RuvC/YqgF family)
MMVARTDEQLIEAISNLQKWDANKGTAPLSENRHLLVLSLKQQRELLEEKNREKIAREAEQISLIDGQKIEISQMMSTVEKLQNQIEALQNQIEALEAIDENVQEKRKSL